MCRLAPALLFALLASTRFLTAQTTGGITGLVTDDSGAPLPGVTVEARSPVLQGTKTAVTGNDGAYRLALLPPGAYTVASSLTQYGRAEKVTLNLIADVFNLLNVQKPILLDQRYNFAEFADADYVCGSNRSSVDEPKCNERYGQAFLRQGPRALRLGARISF